MTRLDTATSVVAPATIGVVVALLFPPSGGWVEFLNGGPLTIALALCVVGAAIIIARRAGRSWPAATFLGLCSLAITGVLMAVVFYVLLALTTPT